MKQSKMIGSVKRLTLAWLAMSCTVVLAGEDPAVVEDASPAYVNHVKLSGSGALLDGDKASFKRSQQVPVDAWGGLEDLYYRNTILDDVDVTVEGRAIFDNNDYHIRFKAVKSDLGYVDAGYTSFRTYYNGAGGFYRGTVVQGLFFELYNEDLFVDRSNIWFEGALTLEDLPVMTFRYDYITRTGKKDSTSWGDTTLTDGALTRAIAPAFWSLDEERHVFAGKLSHTIDKVSFGAGATYTRMDNADTLNIARRPNQVTTYREIKQENGLASDDIMVNAWTKTDLNDDSVLSTAYQFETAETTLTGGRIFMYPTLANRQARDEGYLNMSGGSDVYKHVGNIGYMTIPVEDVKLLASLRAEHRHVEGEDQFIETNIGTTAARLFIRDTLTEASSSDVYEVTENVEVRYNGIEDWAFYASGEWTEGTRDVWERSIDLTNQAIGPERKTRTDKLAQKYTVGSNWYPRNDLTVSSQFYHKVREYNMIHPEDDTTNAGASGNRYPAYLMDQEITTEDFNIRIKWRPLNTLTLATRYDFQLITIDTTGAYAGEIESGETTTHTISESLTWSPVDRWFIQVTGGYTMSITDTPASSVNGPSTGVIDNFQNDYYTATVVSGFAIDDMTSLQAEYVYMRTDNARGNYLQSMPYGSDTEQHSVTLALTRKINDNITWTMKYGYVDFSDGWLGEMNDFDAHMVYSGVEIGF